MAPRPTFAGVALLALLVALAGAQPLGADAGARRMLLKAKKNAAAAAVTATAASSSASSSNTTISAAAANGTISAAATPRQRFVRNALVASDASMVAYTSFNVLRSAAQLAQPFAAAATSGTFRLDAPTLLTLGSLVAQSGAAANDLATKISYLVSRSSASLG